MNLKNYTKAELISKIQGLENKKSKTIEKSVDKKINDNKINDNNTSISFYSIFLKIKTLILSLTIIGILSQIFKNYKTIRVILKAANYIILGIFGMSIFDAFGLGFIVKFLGELKYILGAGVAYLTDTTFYNYLTKIFNVAEEKDSIRDTYKKSEKIDWKAEFEKAERQREIEKWKERYAKHNEDGIDKKTILLALLLLGASIGTWYYGKEALDIISPLYNISNVIKNILRGRNDDDDDDDNNNIQLDPDSRAVSPDMLVYASDMVNPKLNEHLPQAPPAPPMPNDQPAHTEQGPPNSLLDQIKRGKSLKKAITKESSNEFAGKEVNKVASSSKLSLTDKLSNRLDEIRSVVKGDEEEIMDDIGGWDDNSETTPTQSTIIDKGKGKETESPRSDKAELGIINDKKNKFLDAITRNESKIIPPSNILSDKNDGKILSPSKVANILKGIVEKFPNLSQETLEKLSTVEGLKNRAQIIESLSEDELKTNDNPLNYFSNKTKEMKDMSKEEVIKMNKLIKSTLNLDSENVIEKLNTEFPDYNFDVDSYRKIFMDGTEEEINSGKTVEERDRIRKEILDADLLELQNTGGTSNIKEIRNVIRENYTHNNLLNSIKNKASLSSIKIEEDSNLTELINRGKNLQTLEDLKLHDKVLFEYESSKVKPDTLIDKLKDLPDYAEDSYIDKVITENIDENIKNMIAESEGKVSKQYIIERLLLENPNHKDKILSVVGKTFDEQLEYWENTFSSRDFARLKKALHKEDLKELQELGENKTIDQLRTVATINKSHINLLKEIKNKASQTSLKKENPNNLEASNDSTSSSIDQIDNTMNLFD